MGTDRRHAGQITAAVVTSLFAMVLVSNVLWPGAPPAASEQARWPSGTNPFPSFPAGPELHVVPVGPDTNLSTRLLLASLQGLANRVRAELYLDVDDEAANASSMLSFLVSKYHLRRDRMTIDAAISAYLPSAAEIVVYDPARPESINVATMIAAQRDAVLVGPDLSESLHARTGLPVFDYATSDWAPLDPVAATDRALRDLYPGSSPSLLAILPPDRWAIRDYLIATRTFVFYEPQGALATPPETAATMRVLRATPRNIPILGWFDSPTLTEENAFVQMASAEGKFVVGVQDLPNLSVLTAFGRNDTHRQIPTSAPSTALEDKTYVVVAVPDGDNVDFISGRMRELWSEPARGTVPLAWSIDPLLVDLAPPLLDWYYDTATPNDRFVAAPSGAGYLYPDYTGPGDLPGYLALTERYMAAADLDVVWLLNAFTASEIPYSDGSLSAYVRGVHPEGIVLDYDDQPGSRDVWVASGGGNASPVIRSTHFWTTADNVLGKIDAAAAAWGDGPHFLWLTVYTFRFDLADAVALVDVDGPLAARLGGNLEIVTPTTFFALLRQAFVREAGARLDAAWGDPIASTLFAPSVDLAAAQVAEARAAVVGGDSERAAQRAFIALETLRGIGASEALLLSLIVLLAAGALAAFAQRSARRTAQASDPIDFGALVLVAAAVAFFVFALREAVEQNFWTYPSILLGIAVAGFHRPLRRSLDRAYSGRAPVVAALACLVLSSLAIRTTAAFPLAMIGTLLAIDSYLVRKPATPSTLLAALGFGTAIGFFGGFDLVTFSAIAVLLVVPPLFLPEGAPPAETAARPHRAVYPGILLAMPLTAFALTSSYALSLRLQIQGDLLPFTAAAMLVLGPTLAIVGSRIRPGLSPTTARVGGLSLAVASSGLVLASKGTLPTTLALLALFTSLSFAALAGLRESAARGGDPRHALATAILLLPTIVLFFRLPPITYSLTVVPLPEAVEYFLYTPAAIIAATSLVLLAAGWILTRKSTSAKDYPGEPHGGASGP